MVVSGVNEAVFSDPELFLWYFQQTGSPLDPVGSAVFVRMKETDFSRTTFLDERLNISDPELVIDPDQLAELYSKGTRRNSAAAYIFHSAFCCSTLMARLLEFPGKSLSLKEPQALAQLANWKRGIDRDGKDDLLGRWEALVGASVANMTAGFSSRQKCQIKLHNCCNNIFRPLLANGARGLFMYSSLKSFLVLALKSANRRRWVHNQLSVCAPDARRLVNVRSCEVQRLKDPEAAAYLWLLNVQSYIDAAESGDLPLRALDCDVLLQNPLQATVRVVEHLGLEITEQELAEKLGRGAMETHAKTGAPGFDKVQRKKEMRKQEKELRREISHGLWWASRCCENLPEHRVPGHLCI